LAPYSWRLSDREALWQPRPFPRTLRVDDMRRVRALQVLSAFRQGSSWPVLIDTGSERLFTKLHATAHGSLPLVAEIVVGELADALGLATPARCLVEIEAGIRSLDPHEELLDLLRRSAGLNLGFQLLEGYRDLKPPDTRHIPPELAASIVWLDALVQNPDRTQQNPNLMIKAGRVCLIDNGSALTFHHDWDHISEQTPRQPGTFVEQHLLQVSPSQLEASDAELAPRLTREVLERALAAVPDEFMTPLVSQGSTLARQRAAYVAYLWKRLRAPRPFVNPGKKVPFRYEF
jgi:HipA-like protein